MLMANGISTNETGGTDKAAVVASAVTASSPCPPALRPADIAAAENSAIFAVTSADGTDGAMRDDDMID